MNRIRFFLAASFFLLFGALPTWAENSIIVDNETGCVLEEHGFNSRVPVASLTKVALAMVVLDWANLCKKNNQEILDRLVELPPNGPTQGPANPLGLQPGDRLTLRDLLYLSLLLSDSEASRAIAYSVGIQLPNAQQLAPVDNFVSHMNALALELKMTNTLFLNPSGCDMPHSQPYSTVADLARLVRYAYTKPGLSFYVAQKSREIHVERGGKSFAVTIKNTNMLLGKECIDGVKTGNTARAGKCLILTSEHRPEVKKIGSTIYTAPRRIIVIVLNDIDPFQEGLALIHRGWSLYDAWAAEGRVTSGHQIL